MSRSSASTRNVRIEVESHLLAERSSPENNSWFFIYHVRISNDGDQTVQLVSRHWIITDQNGHVEEVQGPGVVGEKPVLQPKQTFEYTSGCPLSTPFGIMHGTYQMVTQDGDKFDAEVAPFQLGEPTTIH